jgi:hypothetical protein
LRNGGFDLAEELALDVVRVFGLIVFVEIAAGIFAVEGPEGPSDLGVLGEEVGEGLEPLAL